MFLLMLLYVIMRIFCLQVPGCADSRNGQISSHEASHLQPESVHDCSDPTLCDDGSLSYPLGPGGGHVPVSIQDVKSFR